MVTPRAAVMALYRHMQQLLASGLHLGRPLPGFTARHGHRYRAAAAWALVHKELHLRSTPETSSLPVSSAYLIVWTCCKSPACGPAGKRLLRGALANMAAACIRTRHLNTHALRCGRPDDDAYSRVCDSRPEGPAVGEQLVEHSWQLQPWHSTRTRAAFSPGSSATRVVSIYRQRS